MSRAGWEMPFGAAPLPEGGARVRVWAPGHESVEVVVEQGADAGGAVSALEAESDGYFSGVVPELGAGGLYKLRLDGADEYPDPASRHQPRGVHGPSRVVDPAAHHWADGDWAGLDPDALTIYELHVGTATEEGTCDALIEVLDEIAAVGATAIELMPVAQFSGGRNWGYDGVYLYAPADSYGGPDALKRLVDAAHARGLGVVLDVVYNHLGPEGNYLPAVTSGRYFTDTHHTPWGDAVNFDGPDSQGVREFVIQNALYWIHEYHIDGLRLDATHAIIDESPRHVLRELTERVRESAPRPVVLIAEDERNDRRVVLPASDGGLGFDAVWADDLHHQLRSLTAGDDEGYFSNYTGSVEDLARTLEQGWYFDGTVKPAGGVAESDPAAERRGTPTDGLPPRAFVHCIQNHDQVGNRARGERLHHEIDPAVYRAASALLMLSPYTPLIWMGQEWAASTPFLYFTDHPEELGRLVTEGRREEFKHFSAFADPAARERIPDPQAEDTFLASKLVWDERQQGLHAGVLRLYQELGTLRRQEPALRRRSRGDFSVQVLGEASLALRRSGGDARDILLVADLRGELRVNLCDSPATAAREGSLWGPILATEQDRFYGAGGWGRLEPEGVLHLMAPGAVVLAEERRGQRR